MDNCKKKNQIKFEIFVILECYNQNMIIKKQ